MKAVCSEMTDRILVEALLEMKLEGVKMCSCDLAVEGSEMSSAYCMGQN